MSKIHPECSDSDFLDWLLAANILVRLEPDEEDEEEEDEDRKKEDDDDEDDDNEDGYSE